MKLSHTHVGYKKNGKKLINTYLRKGFIMNNNNIVRNAILKIIGLTTLALIFLSSTIGIMGFLQMNKISTKSLADENLIRLEQIQINIVQVQQFLTDASLTHEEDPVKEAKDNFLKKYLQE